MNHKNRTILLLFHSCDDSSKCDLNNGRLTLVDECVLQIGWIFCIHQNHHWFGDIKQQFTFERHACICGTEQFLSVWVNHHFNLGNTKLLLECSDAYGRQIISHVLNKLIEECEEHHCNAQW